MKRTLWIASTAGAAALAMMAGTQAKGGPGPSDLAGLQQAIGATSVADLTATSSRCHICDKNLTCSPVCQREPCKC